MSKMVDFRSWWDLAACQRADPELFFPLSSTGPARMQLAQAKAVCSGCSVRQRCLDYAMAAREAHGVWGGMSEEERRVLRARALGAEMDRAS